MFNFFAEDMLTPLDTANRDTIDYEYLVSKLIANWSHERKKKEWLCEQLTHAFSITYGKMIKTTNKNGNNKKKHSSQMSDFRRLNHASNEPPKSIWQFPHSTFVFCKLSDLLPSSFSNLASEIKSFKTA